MKFRIPAILRNLITRTAPQPEVPAPPQSAASIKARIKATKRELHALNDAFHVALAHENGLRAYRVQLEVFTNTGEHIVHSSWSTCADKDVIVDETKAFMASKLPASNRFAEVSGEAIFTDLLTGESEARLMAVSATDGRRFRLVA